jgi:hypothetical protein
MIERAGHLMVTSEPEVPLDEALDFGQCGAIVVDCEDAKLGAAADAAARFGARFILFSGRRPAGDVWEMARQLGVHSFTLPITDDDFRSLLTDVETEWAATRSRRFMDSLGRRWYVRELPANGAPGRMTTSLVFWRPSLATGDHVARRVWRFPADWRSLDDTALEALCEAPPGRPT